MKWLKMPRGFEPFDSEAREFHRSASGREPVDMEGLHERDMVEFRRIMGTINAVAKALHTPPEKLRAELLVATGNFQLLGEHLGKQVVAVSSMSRHSMKDHELHEFWDEAKEIIKSQLLPRIENAAERERLAATLSLQPA
ncbi:hypothetical protein JQ604_14865 [Bradyrhizobium jicamae]|uniref:Transcriptional regulator n=1 Tax=Bradyrhizobium zhanjiangense TaxID=1325107 RepID=A0ABY0DFS8_9BRAD|nr:MULTISPECIES: hypothetical protein [Bradyrhizobium]MBR0753467.1 hypothetical protein [Bradyrhizobium jicamae]RXG91553.1 hypothetical protein EAS62_24035 [Bradyrhizobium zhanjiangense]